MKVVLFTILFVSILFSGAQPTIDSTFRVTIDQPMFQGNARPSVLIDEAHNNVHKKEGGLYSFTRMMEEDGAKVFANEQIFTIELLSEYDVLIIVNALHDSNVGNWKNPCLSAFTETEIDAVEYFVRSGGSLLFVADHMPLGGAAQDLAKKFNIEWSNSFAMQNGNHWPPSVFERDAETLLDSPVTVMSANGKQVSKVGTFTGSAFRTMEEVLPFLVFDNSHTLLMPEIAWQFNKKTKNESAEGWLQGACMNYGKGKMVLLGEAAMITAQMRGKTEIGMNSPNAPENAQLALNIFRYLAAK